MKIVLKDISKSFNQKKVLDSICLEIEDKSFTTLLGSSGCGKTTLLRMIAGLETPDSGEIYFDEKCIFSSTNKINIPSEKRNLSFVFQDFALWPHMTVFENVAFGLKAKHKTQGLEAKVTDALKAVHLEDYKKTYPNQLSGGQQQRVAFARAIVNEPKCILFDEPLSALDAILREEMRNEITGIVSDLGITSVFVTHDQEEAMSMSSKIAVMNGGHVLQYDSPEDIYNAPSSKFVASFIGKSNWIDEEHMFRPESITLEECGNTKGFEVAVEGSQFLGDKYKLQTKYKGFNWTCFSKKNLRYGSRVNIFVPANEIICVK